MEELIQAKKLIESARNVLVLVPKNASIDDFGSAISLSYTLNKTGKIVNLLPKRIPEPYTNLFSQKFMPKNFVISIQGKEVSELYYEKQNQALKIYLTLKDGDIEKEDIHFTSLEKSSPTESDLLITVGLDRLEKLGDFYEKNFRLFYQTPILNIDNHPLNNKFGNINLIANTLPNAIISGRLIKELDQNLLDANVKTWLLAGIIEYSQNKEMSRKILASIFALIEPGLDYCQIIDFFSKPPKLSQKNLLEIILKKLRFNQEKQLSFVCLNKDDFKQADALPKDLGFVLEQLTGNLFSFPCLLILWESNVLASPYRGVFYSLDERLTQKILKQFGGQNRGKGVIFNFKEGKDIAKTQEEVLQII